MKHKLYSILAFLLFSSHLTIAQQFFCKNYTINDGLPDNCIRDLYKDSRGFLWIGTNAGLAKFDGKNFEIISSINGLAGDDVWAITESKDGCIWVGCNDGGISKLNGKEIVTFNTQDGLISNDVKNIYFSEKYNLLFIGTEDGLSIYNGNEFISFHENLNNISQRLQVDGFLEDSSFVLIFTNGNGLYKYIPNTKSLVQVSLNHPINNYFTSSAYISKNNETFINFQRKKLKVLNGENIDIHDDIGLILDFKEDLDGNVWIAAWNNNYLKAGGIFKYDGLDITKFNSFLDIQTDNIISLEFDSKENLLWIGTEPIIHGP